MQKNNQKRAALYVRASWDDMSADDSAIASQETKLKKYCTAQNYIFSDEQTYRDIASGVQPPEERRGLKQLLDAARRKEFDVVVVYRIDRLARNTHLFLELTNELRRLDIEFQSATESLDTSELSGRMLLRLLASMAEMERANLHTRRLACYCNIDRCHCNC